ncbi:ATP-binding protein [Streptomyces sp. NPDC058471]|uniref:sensor histidine kinase n=1 Tax=Streptomyces sp. NPDC058471 TaxID=3346516 RepID=UPI003659D081
MDASEKGSTWWALSAVGLVGVVLAVGVHRFAMRTASELHRQRAEVEERTQSWLHHFAALVEESDKGLRSACEQVSRGESATMPATWTVPAGVTGNPWQDLDAALRRSHRLAWSLAVGRQRADTDMSQVFVYLAGGLFVLVVRALKILNERAKTVQDPETLYDLLDVDNLLRRVRRYAGRFAVLGGQRAREVEAPIRLFELLRGSAAEIERFAQVRIDTPELAVQFPAGSVGPDLIHLLAELIENATMSSPPRHKVTVKTVKLQDDLLVEVEDRGLGMTDDQLTYFNRVLGHPQDSDLAERLGEQQTGLLVVARLAGRYGIRVRLERNFFKGTTALVAIPEALLEQPAAQQGPQEGGAAAPQPLGSSAPSRAGGPRPSRVAQGPAAASLPRRRPPSTTATAPASDQQASPAAPQKPSLGARPPLPRRARQPDAPRAQPTPTAAAGTEAPPPAPNFAANFTAGMARAEADEPAAPRPPTSEPQSDDG